MILHISIGDHIVLFQARLDRRESLDRLVTMVRRVRKETLEVTARMDCRVPEVPSVSREYRETLELRVRQGCPDSLGRGERRETTGGWELQD